jgi:hypothetical protein
VKHRQKNMENETSQEEITARVEQKLKDKNRFDQLSEKVILTSKERDAEVEARKKVEAERDSILKEKEFYKDFSVNVAKYPGASEYQDRILEKVRSGYSTEDAMVSVLAKEGKLSSPPAQQPYVQVEGGSAPTISGSNKSLRDMTKAEKLSALAEADKTGELASALMGR